MYITLFNSKHNLINYFEGHLNHWYDLLSLVFICHCVLFVVCWMVLCPLWKMGAYCLAPVSQSFCRTSDGRSISIVCFAWKWPKLVQPMLVESRWPHWCSGHMVKGEGETAGLWIMFTQCLLNRLLESCQTGYSESL